MSVEGKNTKKKFPIGLIICLAIVLACGGATVATLVLRNVASNKPIEIGENMEASDAATLRKILATQGTCTVTITEDITVTDELDVYGDKTLVGKSIIMDTRNIGSGQSVLAVQSGARLTLDGATVDGNGVVTGIAVKLGSEFTALSGQVIYGYPYGMTIGGTATIKDITIDQTLHTGIYVEYGGKLDMTGGVVKHNVYGVAVASGASMTISEEAKIVDAFGDLVSNFGTMTITGGEYYDCYGRAIFNRGEMTIEGTAAENIKIHDVKNGIVSNQGSTLTAKNLHIYDTTMHAMAIQKGSKGTVEDCTFERNTRSAFYINASEVVAKNLTISDGESYGVFAQNGATLEIEDVTVTDMKSRGVANDNSKVIAKNIDVKNLGSTGFYTTGKDAKTTAEDIIIVKAGASALGITGGNVKAKNITIEEPKNEGVYVGKDTYLEIDNVTVKKSGLHGVANRGGKLILRNAEIISAGQCAFTLTNKSETATNGVEVKDSAWQAISMSGESQATMQNWDVDKTGKASVYVQNGTLSLKKATIKNAKTVGVHVEKSPEDAKKKVVLDQVTIDTTGDRGIQNMASYVVITNLKVINSKGAGVYARGAAALTNMNQVEVTNPGASGYGLVGGRVTGRNLTVVNSKNEGVYVGKDANVRLDNVSVTKPGTHGVGNYGGILDITVDKGYNPENSQGNGITITSPGKRGMHIEGGKVTATSVTIKDTPQQAVAIDKEANVKITKCEISETGLAAVRMSNSTLNLKNATLKDSKSYGVYVEKSTKDAGKVANLENVTIIKPGDRGVGNIGSYVVMKDIKVTDSKGAGIYTSGEKAITNMNQIELKNAGASGLGLTAGTATARNVTVTNSKGEGVHVGEKANVRIDNVVVTDSGNHGVINYGTLNITADTNYNPENTTGNGITITNPKGSGIVLFTGKVTSQGVSLQDTNEQDTVLQNGIVLKENTEFTGSGVTIKNTTLYGVSIPETAKATLSDTHIEKTGQGYDGINTSGTLIINPNNLNDNGVTVEETGEHGIYVGGGEVTANDVTIQGTAKKGLNVVGGANVTVTGLTVAGAGNNGIYFANDNTVANISDFVIDKAGAAAIRLITGAPDVTLTNGTVTATTYGLYMSNGSQVNATNVKIDRVKDNKDTLVVLENTSSLTMNNSDAGVSSINGNGFEGRGVELKKGTTFTLNGGTIQNNKLANGAGVVVRNGATFVMNEGAVLSNNIATTDGGAMFVEGGTTVKLNGGSFSGNKAGNVNNDIYFSGDTAKLILLKELTGDVVLKPKTYGSGVVVAAKDENLADSAFQASVQFIKIQPKGTEEWVVEAEGAEVKLVKTIAMMNGVGYKSFEAAVQAANQTAEVDTITLLGDVAVANTIAVTESLKIQSDVAVSITADANLKADMFSVAAGKSLEIAGKSADVKIGLVGTSTVENVIKNEGTVTLTNTQITGGKKGVFVNNGVANANGLLIQNTEQAMRIEGTNANVQINNTQMKNSKSYGLVVKAGTVTAKNTVIDNADKKEQVMYGVAAHGGVLNFDNVTIKNFVGTKNTSMAIELKGSQINVTTNEVVVGGTNHGLYISNIYGHCISATVGTLNASNIKIAGTSGVTRAGIKLAASKSGDISATITNAAITGCAANNDVQLQNASITINNKTFSSDSTLRGKALSYFYE